MSETTAPRIVDTGTDVADAFTLRDSGGDETGSTVPLFLGGLPAIFSHIEVLDGFRSVGEYLVIAAVYGNRYIRHKVYMNRLSMKSKQFVNGYQRI